MLYLIEPNGRFSWNSMPAMTTLSLAKENPGVDLARLDWKDSEQPPAFTVGLRLALRHGTACSRGIVIDAGLIANQQHADEIRTALRNVQIARAEINPAHNTLMERLIPGRTEHGRQLDEQVVASSEGAALEAEEYAAEDMEAPVDPQLADHWSSLGGILPRDL